MDRCAYSGPFSIMERKKGTIMMSAPSFSFTYPKACPLLAEFPISRDTGSKAAAPVP